MSSGRQIAVFDLCGTLVRDDTTLGLLDWHFRRTNAWVRGRMVSMVRSKRHPVRWGFALLEKLLGRAVAKHALVLTLRGVDAFELQVSADQYAQWLVDNRMIQGSVDLMASAREDGCMLLIASASLEPIVQAIGHRLGMHFVASTLSISAGRLQGRYSRDIAGCKESAMCEKFGAAIIGGIGLTVSDNFTDLGLMRRSRASIAIAHDERHAERWARHGVRVLRVERGSSLSLARWIIPFRYLFISRLGARQDRISWFLVHPVPVLYLAAMAWPEVNAFNLCAATLMGLIALQAIYEVGYIDNDVFTVKRELAPTVRLAPAEMKALEKAFPVVASTKGLIFVLAVAGAGLLLPLDVVVPNIIAFLVASAAVMVAFVLHNRVRNRWNVLTYFVLAAGRYASVPLLINGLDSSVLLVAVAMMPIPRTLEHACKPKYAFNWLRSFVVPFTRFRPIYYAMAMAIYAVLVIKVAFTVTPGLILVYFLLYRAMVHFTVRRGLVQPTTHAAYENERREER